MVETVPQENALPATAVPAKMCSTSLPGAPNIPGIRLAANASFLTNLEAMLTLSTTTLTVLPMWDSGKSTT